MTFFISFLPWIAYGTLDRVVGWTGSVLAGLLITVAVLVYKRITREPIDVLSIGGLVFFVAMFAASPLLAGSGFQAWTQTASHGWIALLMWLSIAVRAPFTLAFSRSEAPAEVVGTPEFLRFNDVITAIWAISFTVGTGVLVALLILGITAGSMVVVVASIVTPIVVMNRYIAKVQREMAPEMSAPEKLVA